MFLIKIFGLLLIHCAAGFAYRCFALRNSDYDPDDVESVKNHLDYQIFEVVAVIFGIFSWVIFPLIGCVESVFRFFDGRRLKRRKDKKLIDEVTKWQTEKQRKEK